jgi:hypothetical protein
VDLAGQEVEVHHGPGPRGYGDSRTFGPGERVFSAAVGGLSVDAVLG